jgi:acetyltransferase-like isoleucine patch superfamily enzyme
MVGRIITLTVAFYFRLTSSVYLKIYRVKTSGRVRLSGFPLIKNKGQISLGAGSDFRSLSSFTALGVPNQCILNTLSPNGEIIIGKDCGLSGAIICAKERVVIGDRVQIGSGAVICDTDFHPLDHKTRGSDDDLIFAESSPILIGDDCFIGARTIILKGVSVGARSIVGAGSVVTKNVPADVVVAGNPVKNVRNRTS